jgi:myo-inositol-1(or 4)-monophosphatase
MNLPVPRDPLIDWAPDGLSLCLINCARLALDRQKAIRPACKPDGTLVTPADTEIEARLEAFLLDAEPDSRVLGEETLGQKGRDYLAAALRGDTWVIDPVDGTVLYAMGMPGWGISLGRISGGRMERGVVVYPGRTAAGDHFQFLLGRACGTVCVAEAFWPAGDDGATAARDLLARLVVNCAPIKQLPVVEGFPGLFAVSQRVAKQSLFRGPQPLVSLGSCVATFRQLMDGGIVAYLVKLKLWDIAAVLPLAWSLGLRACRRDGLPFGLDLTPEAWILDPDRPDFLGLTDHMLFYRSDRSGPELLDYFDWPTA